MNQKQYIRLSLVLAIPALVVSFWLAQQDFVFNRGQIVTCSINSDYCYHQQMPLDKVRTYAKDYNIQAIEYDKYSSEKYLGIYNVDFQIKVYLRNQYGGDEIDATNLVSARMLEANSCSLSATHTLICDEPLFSWASSYGRIEFINEDEYQQFLDRITKAQSYFEDYFLIQIAIGFGLFLSIVASYLTLSWLVHFVIYGAKIGKPKKSPYQ